MTLDEEVRLMYGVARPRGVHSVGYVAGIDRLGVPPLVLSDGPVGVRDSCWNEKYPDNCKIRQSTALPATVSLAASFDPGLARRYGSLLGAEARARGVDVIYGPAMDIVRVPQGGRNFEYFSEDPFLTGSLATAYVQGVQSQDVAAQAKHFALNNQENDRHGASSNAGERTQREIYLPAWQQVTGAGGADSVMCANNLVDGTYSCANTHLLREVLEGEWGWPGVVGSDYGATTSTLGPVNGGLDEEFSGRLWGEWYSGLAQLVRSGKLSRAVVDAHVRRILRMMFELGMFDAGRSTGSVRVRAHGAVARTVAERGAVLLKNAHGALPLRAGSVHSVAVLGNYAATALTGGAGSSKVNPYFTISPVREIRQRVGPKTEVSTADGSNIARAVDLARRSDVAVVIANDVEQEGRDRSDIALPGDQNRLIRAVAAANPHTVVVLETGSAVTMPWLAKVPAVLEMWYPGEEGGAALAALLFGDENPSGKLPVTFPTSLRQDCCHSAPRYPEHNHAYDYSEGLRVGYRWYDAHHLRPLFPFGYGLSYTDFRISGLTLGSRMLDFGQPATAHLQVTNTGSRAGIATPQVYLAFPPGAEEPPRRLVATAKVPLAGGESKTVTITLPARSFAYWNTQAHNWDFAGRAYTVLAGTSSRDLPVQRPLQIRSAVGVQGIGVQVARTVAAGHSITARVTISNTGDVALSQLTCRLLIPRGWQLTTVRAAPPTVAARSSATATYRIQAPEHSGPGAYVLTARASWSGLAPGTANRAMSIRSTVS